MSGFDDIVTWFAAAFDINTTAAQLILSTIVILMVMIPFMIASRGSKSILLETIALFLSIGILTALGWLPFWIMIMIIGLVAISVAFLGTKVVTGG